MYLCWNSAKNGAYLNAYFWHFFNPGSSTIGTIRIHHECKGGIEKSVPRITNWHNKACRVMQMVITGDGFFYPTLTQIMDFFLLTTKYHILYWKTWKRLPENPEFADMRHGEVILTFQWRHGSTCDQHAADVRLFVFYPSHGLVRVC